jgi:cyanophycin synthetase
VTESVALTPHPDLKIISSRVFRGPNVWHYEPAIQLVVDLGVLEDFPTNKLLGFPDALVERLPGLMNHTGSRGRRGGFVERLTRAPGLASWPNTSRCSCSRPSVTTCAVARPGR